MKTIAFVLLTSTLSLGAGVNAADRADLDATQIIGSRELPKVLYIVPWKQPLPTELVGRPATSLLDEVLAPVDREVFERQVTYHALTQGAPKPTTGAVSGGQAK
jgi:hypothetical protein